MVTVIVIIVSKISYDHTNQRKAKLLMIVESLTTDMPLSGRVNGLKRKAPK